MTRGFPKSNAFGIAGFEPTATMALSYLMYCWPSLVSTRSVFESSK